MCREAKQSTLQVDFTRLKQTVHKSVSTVWHWIVITTHSGGCFISVAVNSTGAPTTCSLERVRYSYRYDDVFLYMYICSMHACMASTPLTALKADTRFPRDPCWPSGLEISGNAQSRSFGKTKQAAVQNNERHECTFKHAVERMMLCTRNSLDFR